MGGVAGILHWDGRPIDPRDLDRLTAASPHRGVDGITTLVRPPIALAHLRFVTIPTEDPRQPVVHPVRDLVLVFDGRLDNRDELRLALGVDPGASDARIVLEAVARWGSGTPEHLLGDFAFVAWDGQARQALCARDHMGARPLHYHASGSLLVCGTDLAQVLAHPDVPRAPNPDVAADYLAMDIQNGPGTLYRHVHRVPPGHVVVATDGRVRLERYWSPEPAAPIRYRTDEEYAAECRDILVRSVGCRMRSDRPTSALLSGGLDSSSVVTVAHRLVRGQGEPPRPFSMVFPDHPESDERPFIDAVTRACGTTGVQVVPGPITADALRGQAERWIDAPGMPADEMAHTLWRAISAHGHRVTLTGAGGDFLFTGSVFQYADLLRRGRPIAAVRRFIDDWRADDTGRSALGLLQAGVWPLLPAAMKDTLRPLARRVYGVTDQPAWLRIRRSVPAHPARPRGGSYATEDVTRQLGSGGHAFFLETQERAAAESGVEVRNPLLDRRLVEFALSIPDDQRKRGPYTKYVLRRALDGHLAEMVSRRRTKADFAHAIADALETLGGERLFSALRIADVGWVDAASITAKYRLMRTFRQAGDLEYGVHIPALWMIAAVELWFRAAFDRHAPAL